MLRAAGADAVLLLAVLHPAQRLARLVDRALDLGLEPLVEAHDERELERALATSARLIGLNNRDLRTLAVDTGARDRLLPLVPDDRVVVAESGVRDAATIAAWRAPGFDAALVGEALVRAADPAAAARAFVAAGRVADDPANAGARAPCVKICGITDADGHPGRGPRPAPTRSGSTSCPGRRARSRSTRRSRSPALARSLAGRGRPASSRSPPMPRRERTRRDRRRPLDPDAVQLSGDEPADDRRRGRPAGLEGSTSGVAAATPTTISRAAASSRGPARSSRPGAARILLDTAGGPHPGGTGTPDRRRPRRAVAREVPIVLAGGLDPANVGRAAPRRPGRRRGRRVRHGAAARPGRAPDARIRCGWRSS